MYWAEDPYYANHPEKVHKTCDCKIEVILKDLHPHQTGGPRGKIIDDADRRPAPKDERKKDPNVVYQGQAAQELVNLEEYFDKKINRVKEFMNEFMDQDGSGWLIVQHNPMYDVLNEEYKGYKITRGCEDSTRYPQNVWEDMCQMHLMTMSHLLTLPKHAQTSHLALAPIISIYHSDLLAADQREFIETKFGRHPNVIRDKVTALSPVLEARNSGTL